MSDDQRRPMRAADAARHGVPRRTLLGEQYQRVFRDSYVPGLQPLRTSDIIRAALAISPHSYGVCHHTAATLLGGVVPESGVVHIAVPEPRRCEREGIRVHRYQVPPSMQKVGAIAVTAPAQTFVDMANHLGLVDLVVLADSLLKATKVDAEQLHAAAVSSHGRGARLARKAAGLCRENVDSPRETRLRLLMVLAGLPEPAVNLVVCDSRGRVRKLDLAYEDARFAIEYDGRHHVELKDQWHADIDRRECLESAGWRLIVVVARDLDYAPEKVLERIVAGLRERGVDVGRISPRWRAHFEPKTDYISR